MKSAFLRSTSWTVVLLAVLLLAVPTMAQEEPVAPAASEQADGLVEQSNEAQEPAAEVVATPAPAALEADEVLNNAVDSVVSAVPTSVDDVKGTAGRAWNDFLMPLYERFVTVLPNVLKAFGLLLVFWIVGSLLGRAVTGLLKRTTLDNRLATDLGLGDQLKAWEKKGTSLEGMAGTAVKWMILLLGFVAFFNTLQLTVVAGPLANIFQKLTESIPALLQAFAFLGIYLGRGLAPASGDHQGAGRYRLRRTRRPLGQATRSQG